MKIKVFIVDDHFMVIEGLRALLQGAADIDFTGHATNAASCLAYLKKEQPDVILMDINLPDQSGIDLCKHVNENYPEIAVLAVSSFNQRSFIQNMLDSGAKGYVLKNVTQTELWQAIRAVAIGKTWVSAEVVQTLRQRQPDRPVITRREKEVLECIAQGLTNPQIAEKLFVSITTIESHRKNLLHKLNVNNTASLVRQAFYYEFISIQNEK
ncbi:MAG TPA: response regulator transcription factor [Cyclobacteriaceae bacterium]|jgi:DNA-binding NarL/FixJ family response regulator|nr:response regulator transcription factor [Cytophagales bacterium]HNT49227.1 response regulator transcription factor [Cyclobacteriaceae bacterium]HRE67033.1 response regulator transcription factor [Cyclobacteriaceae bacterium]HRF32356.1 response regulator transcription factor [Cyclobacteriaceae bacterium]